jgi:AcrR family transcriptional regulator
MAASSAKRRSGRGGAQAARQRLYRDLVVDAAEGLFAAQGIEATKMDEIASAADLSLSTVYGAVGGKAAVVDALHEARLSEVVGSMEVASYSEGRPLDMLIAGVRAYAQFFIEHPDYLRFYVDEGRNWGFPVAGRTARAEIWARGHAIQVEIFERGIADGTFYTEEPDRLANTMMAMQQVRLRDWLAGGMQEDPQEVIEGMVLQLRRAFCRRSEDRGDQ